MKRIKLVCIVGMATLIVAATTYAPPIPSILFQENGEVSVTVSWSGWAGLADGSSTLAGEKISALVPVDIGGDFGSIVQGSVVYTEPGSSDISDIVKLLYSPNTRYLTVAFESDAGEPLYPLDPVLQTLEETGGIVWTEVTVRGTGTSSGLSQTFNLGVQSDVEVPDGGLTAMLLGMGMLGIGWVRRMIK